MRVGSSANRPMWDRTAHSVIKHSVTSVATQASTLIPTNQHGDPARSCTYGIRAIRCEPWSQAAAQDGSLANDRVITASRASTTAASKQNISPRFAPLQLRSSERNHPRSCRLTPGFSATGDTVLLNVSKTLQTQPNSAQKTSQMNALFQKILCSKATFVPKPPETPFSPAIIWVTANGYLFAQFGYHRVMRQHSADWVGSEGVSGLTQQQCLPADYTGRLNSSVVRYLRLENFNPEVQEPDPRQ